MDFYDNCLVCGKTVHVLCASDLVCKDCKEKIFNGGDVQYGNNTCK